MNELEKLRHELKLVSKEAPKGIHKKVASKLGWSRQYIGQIRNGSNLYADNEENRNVMKNLILTYRREIQKSLKKSMQKLANI